MELITNLFKAELSLRIISALILIPLAVVITKQGGGIFLSTIYIITLLLAFEWVNMVYSERKFFLYIIYLLFFSFIFVLLNSLFINWNYVTLTSLLLSLISFIYITSKGKWLSFGVFYIGLPMVSIIYLRLFHDLGKLILLWIFCVVWVTDVFSYFGGKYFNGTLISQKISPQKTWSGFFSGILAASLIGFVLAMFLELKPVYGYFLGFVCAVFVQLGDLFESWIKRCHSVKDSSKLLPGHGGVLDRLDGFLFAVTIITIISFYEYY